LTSRLIGVTISFMSVNAEIVTTGTELLLGELADTNSSYIARRLRTIGVNLFYITAVGDNEERMARVLTQGLERSDIIITTGGLGPTVDDVTREAIAQATHRTLVLHEDLLSQIEARFRRWGRRMTENNQRQAYLPSDSIPVENPVGTAPCFIVEDSRGVVISLPGVPREMEYLMENRVLPYLREHFDLKEVIKAKVLKTCAIGESTIDDRIKDLMKLENPTVGLAAHPAQTDVRITAKADSEAQADALIAELETLIRARLGDVIYGVDKQRLEEVVVDLMEQSGTTLAVLDTVTRGAIGRRLTSVAGGKERLRANDTVELSPDSFARQLAAYTDMSEDSLQSLEQNGDALPGQISQAVRNKAGTDLALVVIGLRQFDEKSYAPVTAPIWCGLASAEGAVVRPFHYGGESDTLIPWVCGMALDLVRRAIIGRLHSPDY
jgi:nicotinamide-nucleotide amidase